MIDFALESAEHGFPKTRAQLIDKANRIYEQMHGTPTEPPFGDGWAYGLYARYKKQVGTLWS